jgi:hypothetical protein
MLLITVLSVVGALTLGSQVPAAHAENHCVSGELCIWTGTFYTGSEGSLACYAGTIPLVFPEARSAKNRCGISQELGWSEGGSINWKFCMSPGGERPEPGRFNVYRVGGC